MPDIQAGDVEITKEEAKKLQNKQDNRNTPADQRLGPTETLYDSVYNHLGRS